jgi:signal peptidase II
MSTASVLAPVSLGVLVLMLDQASKALVLRALGADGVPRHRDWGPVRLRRVVNMRPGLGLVGGPVALVLTWCGLLGLTAALLLVATPTAAGGAVRAGLAMALGGATGNLIDRLRLGGVVDFVDLRVWPVFNVADVGIVAGSALALWALLVAPGLEQLAGR